MSLLGRLAVTAGSSFALFGLLAIIGAILMLLLSGGQMEETTFVCILGAGVVSLFIGSMIGPTKEAQEAIEEWDRRREYWKRKEEREYVIAVTDDMIQSQQEKIDDGIQN